MTRELLGEDLPVVGFYCFGEMAPIEPRDAPRFGNETIVALLLGSN